MYSREAIWSRVYFFLTGWLRLHGLVQIQPYGREVAVPGQGKPGSAGRNAALGFIVHSGSCFLFSG